MNQELPLEDFIDLPSTVDFVIRQNDLFFRAFEEDPRTRTGQTLTGGYTIVYVDRRFFQPILETVGESFIRAMPLVLTLLGRESLEAAGILRVQEQPFLDLRGQGVLMGFVDTGIDYTLDTFLFEDGTSKIRYLYDQTIRSTPPEGFFFGTEYTNEQINAALQSGDPFSVVPSRDTSGHGTFLASIAAGREVGDFIGAAPDSELIVVKLRKARPYYLERYLVPPDQENAFESSDLMLGVEYIIKKARELNRPVCICIGIGTNMGSHDGFSVVEEYLGDVSLMNGVCVVSAAGNESQARHHTQGIIAQTGQSENMEIVVGENSGDFFVSIWNNAPDRLSVAVTSPTGELIARVPAKSGSLFQARLVLERTIIQVEYIFPVEGSSGQATIIKFLNPTPGNWVVTVYGDIILEGTYHAYLPITGLGPPDVQFLSPTPYYTIVVPSTAIGPITSGAYNSFNNSLYSNTSWGPTRLPLLSPDFVAPGVGVTGFYPGGAIGTMDGTSVASAITAGAAALLLQWGIVEGNNISLSTYQIRAYLIRGCDRSEATLYPNTQWGYGSINLINSFNLMRGI